MINSSTLKKKEIRFCFLNRILFKQIEKIERILLIRNKKLTKNEIKYISQLIKQIIIINTPYQYSIKRTIG